MLLGGAAAEPGARAIPRLGCRSLEEVSICGPQQSGAISAGEGDGPACGQDKGALVQYTEAGWAVTPGTTQSSCSFPRSSQVAQMLCGPPHHLQCSCQVFLRVCCGNSTHGQPNNLCR